MVALAPLQITLYSHTSARMSLILMASADARLGPASSYEKTPYSLVDCTGFHYSSYSTGIPSIVSPHSASYSSRQLSKNSHDRHHGLHFHSGLRNTNQASLILDRIRVRPENIVAKYLPYFIRAVEYSILAQALHYEQTQLVALFCQGHTIIPSD